MNGNCFVRSKIKIMSNQITAPTKAQSEAMQKSYEYFNVELFNGELPNCMLNFSRSGRRVMGFFIPSTWEERKPNGKSNHLHEISLCPSWLNRDAREVMSTLVHEMVHLWQQEFGSPSRRGYHNKEWARKMVNIGLFPSDTGQRGGKIIGQQMSHYILPGARFEMVFNKIPEENLMPFVCANAFNTLSIVVENEEEALILARITRHKIKYSCSGCKINAWGKPGLHLDCGQCNIRMHMQVRRAY